MNYWIGLIFGLFVSALGAFAIVIEALGGERVFGAPGWMVLILGTLMVRVVLLEDDR